MSRVLWRRVNRSKSRAASLVLSTMMLSVLALGTVPSLAAEQVSDGSKGAADAPAVRHLVVTLDKSRLVNVDRPFVTALPASAEIADIRPTTDHSLYIQGKKVGTTNISLFDKDMRLVTVLDLEVAIDTASLQQKIREATGSRTIRVSSSSNQVVLAGLASDAVAADRAVAVAKSLLVTQGSTVVNAMNVAAAQQVMLKVRFLEASRTAERDLGVNWSALNGSRTAGVVTGNNINITPSGTPGVSLVQASGTVAGTSAAPFGVVLASLANNGANIDLAVTALETKGLVRRLAEPDLIALSGDTARFLAGGEFPVPIAAASSNGTVTPTIEFKKFGVSLAFVPTVLSDGLINLRIAPEVSELDFSNAVTISGTTIPSLITRNAQTTVELRDGQSFAIAGLLQANGNRSISQIPWVGSVPVLGALFRSASYQNHETDLVIIITPHLVRPATPAEGLATPFDQRLPSNDVDLFLNGQMETRKQYSDYVSSGGGVSGPYGHIIANEEGSINKPKYKGGEPK
jgi:pilus assembly protein CpaC